MSSAASRYRVRLLLAKHPDDTQPTVIGCLDETVWENIDEEYEERWRRDAKETFGGSDGALGYEYRECWASFEIDDLANVFAEFELFAEVERDV